MDCMYCEKGEKPSSAAIKICDLTVTELYLFKEQTYHGRVVLVLKQHLEEIYQMDPELAAAFMKDLRRVTLAMQNILHPDKINCGMFGDVVKHLHVHIVPKYKDGPDWNKIFQMNPRQLYLEEAEYNKLVDAYKMELL